MIPSKNIHILPTDKPSRLYISINGGLYLHKEPVIDIDIRGKNQNIYITNDEEIKEGDYFLYDGTKIRYKSNGTEYHGRDLCHISGNHRYPVSESKKIILTTDQDLINNGVQAIDDKFLEWFVNNPSCEEVEVVKEMYMPQSNGKISDNKITHELSLNPSENTLPLYKIISNLSNKVKAIWMIPQEELKTSEEWQKQFPNTKVLDPDGWDRKSYQYSWFEEKITLAEYTTRLHKSSVRGLVTQEESKQETTIEEAAEKMYPCKGELEIHFYMVRRHAFIAGANWQAERMYNEENLYSEIESLIIMWSNDGTKTAGALTRQIMEKFKNK